MRIRTAEARDIRTIVVMMNDLGYPDTDAFISEKFAYLLKHPDYYIITAVEDVQGDERVIGFAVLHIMVELGLPYLSAVLMYLVVDKQARGKGTGKLLEQECTMLARRRGCQRMQLHCSEFRTAAHQFYLKHGYKEWPKYFSKSINEK